MLQRQPAQQAVTLEVVTLQLRLGVFPNKNDQEAEYSLADWNVSMGKSSVGGGKGNGASLVSLLL